MALVWLTVNQSRYHNNGIKCHVCHMTLVWNRCLNYPLTRNSDYRTSLPVWIGSNRGEGRPPRIERGSQYNKLILSTTTFSFILWLRHSLKAQLTFHINFQNVTLCFGRDERTGSTKTENIALNKEALKLFVFHLSQFLPDRSKRYSDAPKIYMITLFFFFLSCQGKCKLFMHFHTGCPYFAWFYWYSSLIYFRYFIEHLLKNVCLKIDSEILN